MSMRFNLPRRATGRMPIYAPRKYTEVLDVLWEAGAALTTHEIADVTFGANHCDSRVRSMIHGRLRALEDVGAVERIASELDGDQETRREMLWRITAAGVDARQWSAS